MIPSFGSLSIQTAVSLDKMSCSSDDEHSYMSDSSSEDDNDDDEPHGDPSRSLTERQTTIDEGGILLWEEAAVFAARLFDNHVASPGIFEAWPSKYNPFMPQDGIEEKLSPKGRFKYPVLLRVRVDKECILVYNVDNSDDSDMSDGAMPPPERNPTLHECQGMSVCLRLPLFLAVASRGGRRIVQVELPEKDVQFQCQSMNVAGKDSIPFRAAGSWFFKLRSRLEVNQMLAQLQTAGCVMRNLERRYKIGKLIGVGANAKVFFASDRLTGAYVAMKITLQTDDSQDQSRLNAMALREAAILRWARHPSILQYRGVFETTDLSTGRHAWAIVTEYISGGELFMKVKNNGPFCEPRAKYVLAQLLSGIDFLHKRGLVHRDIKTENVILLSADGDAIKLVDFGLATPEWDEVSMKATCGSPGYIAPEVLRGDKYDCKVDCFSLGVLLYILLAGHGPFRGKRTEDMLLSNLRCKPNFKGAIAGRSAAALEMLELMLSSDPGSRPTAEECLRKAWFTQAESAEVQRLLPSSTAQASARNGWPKPIRHKRRIYSVELNYHDIFAELAFAEDSDCDKKSEANKSIESVSNEKDSAGIAEDRDASSPVAAPGDDLDAGGCGYDFKRSFSAGRASSSTPSGSSKERSEISCATAPGGLNLPIPKTKLPMAGLELQSENYQSVQGPFEDTDSISNFTEESMTPMNRWRLDSAVPHWARSDRNLDAVHEGIVPGIPHARQDDNSRSSCKMDHMRKATPVHWSLKPDPSARCQENHLSLFFSSYGVADAESEGDESGDGRSSPGSHRHFYLRAQSGPSAATTGPEQAAHRMNTSGSA